MSTSNLFPSQKSLSLSVGLFLAFGGEGAGSGRYSYAPHLGFCTLAIEEDQGLPAGEPCKPEDPFLSDSCEFPKDNVHFRQEKKNSILKRIAFCARTMKEWLILSQAETQ